MTRREMFDEQIEQVRTASKGALVAADWATVAACGDAMAALLRERDKPVKYVETDAAGNRNVMVAAPYESDIYGT